MNPSSEETMLPITVELFTGLHMLVKFTIQNLLKTMLDGVEVFTSMVTLPIQMSSILHSNQTLLLKTVVLLSVMHPTSVFTTSHLKITLPVNTVLLYVGKSMLPTVTVQTIPSSVIMQVFPVQLLHGWV